ncbi:MAG: hypothetical protein OHK0054_12710 [Sideroxydans sp.]
MKALLHWLMSVCPARIPRWLWAIGLLVAALALMILLPLLLWFMSTQIQFM